MGKLVDADKAAHDELTNQLPRRRRHIRASIQVEPQIIEPDVEDTAVGPYSLLGVKIVCGTDELFDRTLCVHMGKREGPGWERSKLIWKHLYQYISDYIGLVVVDEVTRLADEAPYIGLLDETKLSEMIAASADLQRYHESLGYHESGGTYKPGIPYGSNAHFQIWIGQHAQLAESRLRGRARTNVGSVGRLRFSPDDMKRLLDVLENEQKIWKRARTIFWANEDDPDWRAIVKTKIPELTPAVDDDLLEAISQRTKSGDFRYKPIEVAAVSAARHVGVDNKEKWFSSPSMAQYKMISRAVKEWRERFEEAKQLNLRW